MPCSPIFTRTGSVWSQQQKLLPSVAATYDAFGAAVALSGAAAVVGAPGAAGGPSLSGAGKAVVFEIVGGTWTETATLVSPAPANYGAFGRRLALSAGVVVVGSPSTYGGLPPAVHVFRGGAGSWALEAALPTSGPAPSTLAAS